MVDLHGDHLKNISRLSDDTNVTVKKQNEGKQ